MDYNDILSLPPFLASRKEKDEVYLPYMNELTQRHRKKCLEYARILSVLGQEENAESLDEVPMLPISLFKELELRSIPREELFKRVTSSGTTGQKPSVIWLDSLTAAAQQRTLSAIVSEFIGKKRLPMLIIDSPDVLRDRTRFSARGAGILGFSIFGSDRTYALNEDMEPDFERIESFLKRHGGEPVFLFGFTYIVWSRFLERLREGGKRLSIEQGTLIHGGGWKKLEKQAISNQRFKASLEELCKIRRVFNYYGMAEQTGSIYMECECGYLHVSSYSELFVRRAGDFSVCRTGEEGVIQMLSPAALSYPGHSILTEDMGRILGEDDCPCKRKGKYFEITGRIPAAEVRGCSDTYEG